MRDYSKLRLAAMLFAGFLALSAAFFAGRLSVSEGFFVKPQAGAVSGPFTDGLDLDEYFQEDPAGAAGPTGATAPAGTTAPAGETGAAGPASAQSSAAAPQSAKPEAGPVNINTASLEELDTLPGIGPVIAGRIIEYRTKYGNFQSIEELTAVSGIGEITLQKLRDLVCI